MNLSSSFEFQQTHDMVIRKKNKDMSIVNSKSSAQTIYEKQRSIHGGWVKCILLVRSNISDMLVTELENEFGQIAYQAWALSLVKILQPQNFSLA